MTETSAGVMGGSYAEGRNKAMQLQFRFRVRAMVAVNTLLERRGRQGSYRVLELGAAEGRTLLQIRDLLGGQGEFDGVELSDELLGSAPEVPSNVRLLRGDVMALPEELEDESYDLVTALALLEHLPDPTACAREAFRVLRPGGVFVATCPNPMWDSIAGALGMVAEEHHEQKMDKKRLVELANDAGFIDVQYEPFMWAPVGVLPYVNVPVDPALSLRLDAMARKIDPLGLGFVNQMVAAEKPH